MKLCKVNTPLPCDIVGCTNTAAVLVVCYDATGKASAVCPSCVVVLSATGRDVSAFFAQEPLATVIEGETYTTIGETYITIERTAQEPPR